MEDETEDLRLLHCSRLVPFDECERNDPSDKKWWRKTFEILEAEAHRPLIEREELIWETIPHATAKAIVKILTGRVVTDCPLRPSTSVEDNLKHRIERISQGRHEYSEQSIKPKLDLDAPKRRNAPPNNAYRTFFQGGERVAIWRVLPPLKLEEMDMTQKSEAITEIIAADFVEWHKNIGGESSAVLDVPTLKKMFEIGFQTHAATSLCVRVKEMPSVPAPVARARNEPESSTAAMLHKQLLRDIERTKTKTKLYAFGKMLPHQLRHIPPKDNITEKWIIGNKIPQDLATFKSVWGGITNLRSTKAFCHWIMMNRDIPPPPYLQEEQMLTMDFRKYSVDSKESFDPNFGKQILDD